jgi:ribosomal protein RSM22 (predicted rRNA methylase)
VDDLPAALRDAISTEARGHDLRAAVRVASDAYRSGLGTNVGGPEDALAYAVWRLPATYAATLAALRALSSALGGWRPRSLLDVGAGPGTAGWAATTVFGSIEAATFVEAAAPMRELGRRLNASHPVLSGAEWIDAAPDRGADLVIAAYAVGEMGTAVVDRLWGLTSGALLIVEPGTPAGFETVIGSRDRLIGAGAHIAAPCPSHQSCPMLPTANWCHFATRLRRSAMHVNAKNASLPFEDEPFSYVAASRTEPRRAARLVGRPRFHKRLVRLELCTTAGLEERVVTKRSAGYREARKLRWGDAFDDGGAPGLGR